MAGAEPEKVLEYITEARKDVLKTGKPGKACLSKAFMTVPIVEVPLLRVTQDFIRFRSLFEFLLRLLISGISIGMVLESELPVGLLDIGLIGVMRNP